MVAIESWGPEVAQRDPPTPPARQRPVQAARSVRCPRCAGRRACQGASRSHRAVSIRAALGCSNAALDSRPVTLPAQACAMPGAGSGAFLET